MYKFSFISPLEKERSARTKGYKEREHCKVQGRLHKKEEGFREEFRRFLGPERKTEGGNRAEQCWERWSTAGECSFAAGRKHETVSVARAHQGVPHPLVELRLW